MKYSKRNICQRCGAKIYHLMDFGSNEDGTIHTDYCNDCYVGGVFVERGISLEEKIEQGFTSTENEETPQDKDTPKARTIFPKRRRYQEPKAVE